MKSVYLILILLVAGACSDHLNIRRDYAFSIELLPIPKKIKQNETVPLEFTILREDIYKNNSFSFRYFQSDGKGLLMNDKGEHYAVNRFYKLESDIFKMLYRSDCDETQKLDFVFRDSFGNQTDYSVSFQNDNKE